MVVAAFILAGVKYNSRGDSDGLSVLLSPFAAFMG